MIAKRIIPCLDIKNYRVVKGISFEGLADAGDPVGCALEYERQGADELVFLDITATLDSRETIVNLVTDIAEEISIPFTVGGGIGSVRDIHRLLNAGADKVSINTAAVHAPGLIGEASEIFGAQCVVVAIDAGGGEGNRKVYIRSGSTPTEIDVLEWAKELEGLGAGEILLTSICSDGHRAGYDLELTAAVAGAVNIPVIASGGAGGPGDIHAVLTDGKADAALAASIFHYGIHSVGEVKRFLAERAVTVRIND